MSDHHICNCTQGARARARDRSVEPGCWRVATRQAHGVMYLKLGVGIVALSLGSSITKTHAHGGLIIPTCRNNRGPTDLFDFTRRPGENFLTGGSCAGDMCLWFNDGWETQADRFVSVVRFLCSCLSERFITLPVIPGQVLYRLPELLLHRGDAAWHERRGSGSFHQAKLRKAQSDGAHLARGVPHLEYWEPIGVWRLDKISSLARARLRPRLRSMRSGGRQSRAIRWW